MSKTTSKPGAKKTRSTKEPEALRSGLRADASSASGGGYIPPSPMDILQIASWFGLIGSVKSVADDVEECSASAKRIPSGNDDIYRAALRDAAYLYHLAESTVSQYGRRDLWEEDSNRAQESGEVRQLAQIWMRAQAMGARVAIADAARRAGFKTESNFREAFVKFGFRSWGYGWLSETTISVFLELRIRKRKDSDSSSRKKGRGTHTAAEKDPDTHEWRLANLKSAFEKFHVEYDASLFRNFSS